MKNKWSNGSYTVEQINEDQVRISGPHGLWVQMDGGDFEYTLQAMLSAALSSHSSSKDIRQPPRRGRSK